MPAKSKAATRAVVSLPMDQVTPDPDQPRKSFDESAIRELAASIRQNGLLQPITVRRSAAGGFVIIAGESRYRAHKLLEAATIDCLVSDLEDTASIRVAQIIENDQRTDVPALEQAFAYQRLMDEMGWTAEELGQRIGKHWWRVTERTDLLKLQPEYQDLFAKCGITPSQATEMARQPTPRAQALLFRAIQQGKCTTYKDLRVVSLAIAGGEAQAAFAMDEPAPPTQVEVELSRQFENQVDRVAYLLRQGIQDNQITALRKVNPHKAGVLADTMAAMQTDLRRLEVALREMAVQADLMAAD